MNASNLPLIFSLTQESSGETHYDNHPMAFLNDHVVRISKMTEPYPWHFHPNSDEVFLVTEGKLQIEFENGSLELRTGEMITVPRGLRHRTLPVGNRSVNLTFEAANIETILSEGLSSRAPAGVGRRGTVSPLDEVYSMGLPHERRSARSPLAILSRYFALAGRRGRRRGY